jgi:putative membrane protein insertion efficiency factor
MTVWKILVRAPRIPLLLLIRGYQQTFSPDHGPLSRLFPNGYCRFHPSCSQYAYEAVDKLGIIRGLPLALWRVLRCNPWSKGGIDPIPTQK